MATDVNGPGSYKNGTDYRHFEGSDVIPRLTMSDGCLHKCAFCVVPKNLTTQSDAVVDQQADSMSKLGAKLVYLNDKTFGQASNYQHLSDVYDRMKTANPDFKGFIVQTTAAQMSKIPADWLQKSGIKYVELGIESYNDPILKEMHKPANQRLIDQATDKLRQNKIALIPNILIGLPGETAETYNNTLEFLKRNKDTISHANIYNLAVYPDAELGKKLTTASPDDFNENVLEKSFHTNPEVHRQFAGDLYGIGEELLGGKPKPLEETSALAKDQPKKIGDMDENDLTFTGHTNRLYERAATSNAQNGGFTVHPDTGHAPNDGHVIEVMPERRQKIENKPVASAEDIRKFHEANKDVIAENPELHLGGYKNQLNLSAVGTPEGARTVGNKLDQESGWDARNQQLVPYEGKGEKTEFPGYSVDQRLKEMGARDENGKPTNVGVPVKPIEETSGLKKVPAVRELSTGDVAEILENRYHVMEIFFETVGREQISTALEHSIAGAIENMNVGQPIGSIAPTAEAEGEIETAFRFFLSQREMDMLHRGVPTRAAMLGINHRLLHPYARSNPPRPSFIDTGLYQANMRAKFEE